MYTNIITDVRRIVCHISFILVFNIIVVVVVGVHVQSEGGEWGRGLEAGG